MSAATTADLAQLKRDVMQAMAADRLEQARVAQVDRDRTARQIGALQAEAVSLRALVRSIRDGLRQAVGDERIAEIVAERAA